MWQNWDEKVVDEDFAVLAKHGLKTLRVFPLWSDFQPLRILYGEFGQPKEVRMGEKPLSDDSCSQACIDPVMVERFEVLCDLADKYNLQLTVMLLTGWMSGRQFKPEPLQALNTFTDPISLKWQVKFVNYFVSHFRNYPAIIAWGLGNESNVMSPCPSSESAFVWTSLITNTIRISDPARPIISGMHGLTIADPNNPWKIEDQGQFCDIMTTHPYPPFIKYCQEESLISLRSTLLPAAESSLYSDIAGKPCMSEEIGDFGRNALSQDNARIYAETVLWSCWANDNLGCLWWCAFDSDNIEKAPYGRSVFEQGLGMFHSDRNSKPTAKAFTDFKNTIDSLPKEYQNLPPRKKEAICILTDGQDNWATALASFILAKQAGFDIKFIDSKSHIPAAQLYMLPCLCGYGALPYRKWKKLFEQVKEQGSTLYISVFDAFLPDLRDFAGIEVKTRQVWQAKASAHFINDQHELCFPSEQTFATSNGEGGTTQSSKPFKFSCQPCGAEVLAEDSDGLPVFTKYDYGKGTTFFLNFGLEMVLSQNTGSLNKISPDYARLYRTFAANVIAQRVVQKDPKDIGLILSEYNAGHDKTICAAVNHCSKQIDTVLTINSPVKTVNTLAGNASASKSEINISIGPGKAVIIEIISKL